MTEQTFFDTDCLSAFLWVGNENLLVQMYKSKIVLPLEVYEEIKKVPYLRAKTDTLIVNKDIFIRKIEDKTPEAFIYLKLIISPDRGLKIIGRGEAAAIALAKVNDGILASNNLKDIRQYIEFYHLKHITTGDILTEALKRGLITEPQGNIIWANMLAKKRMLPTSTFSDFLAGYK